ncbi:MAG: PTS fructose transporter subunit IIA [Erysipelotrichaceae bacterium]|nr:PTS fructose transporter subunit IIA [Erysipelotrichaceae bacterium]
MIGIIVTGHGEFASGIYSATTTLTGYRDNFVAVDYLTETDTVEDLDKKIRDARASLSNCEDVIVLCDILGGSPFKTAVMAFFGDAHVKVLYGTNVGMAMKLCMECMMANESYDLEAICDSLVAEGNMHIGKYQFVAVEEEDMEDGI